MKAFTIWDRIRTAIYTACLIGLAAWAQHVGHLELFFFPVCALVASLTVNLEVSKRALKGLEAAGKETATPR